MFWKEKSYSFPGISLLVNKEEIPQPFFFSRLKKCNYAFAMKWMACKPSEQRDFNSFLLLFCHLSNQLEKIMCFMNAAIAMVCGKSIQHFNWTLSNTYNIFSLKHIKSENMTLHTWWHCLGWTGVSTDKELIRILYQTNLWTRWIQFCIILHVFI